MKLKKLYIQEYKNLKDFTIDFESGNGLSIIVGNNGSGKSNVLEAISSIFHDLYKNKENRIVKCDYSLEYNLNETDCKIIQTSGRLYCYDNRIINRNDFTKDNAPNSIISIYSGEENRMWTQIYETFYKSYMRKIHMYLNQDRMHLIFINKYYWNVALLTLLLSQNETLTPFVSEELGIHDIKSITLSFNCAHYNSANSLLKSFIDRINPEHNSTITYQLKELKELIFYNYLTDEDGNILIDENDDMLVEDSGITDIEVFRYFTQAHLPKHKKIIKDISIIINDNITIQNLSEGEKKLLLVKTVLEIISDEKSLILLDEPDAHLHEGRKKDLYNLFEEYKQYNRQMVVATHSPIIAQLSNDKELIMLDNNNGKASIYSDEKKAKIKALSGSSWDIISQEMLLKSKKPLVIFEGKTDLLYVNEAINRLSKTEIKYSTINANFINVNGSGNVKSFVENLKSFIPEDKKIIIIFDRDNGGKQGASGVTGVHKDNEKITQYQDIIQNNTITSFIPYKEGFSSGDFLIEDYFPWEPTIKNMVFNMIPNNGNPYKSLPNIKETLKGRIEKSYMSFSDNDFIGFKPLLDKIIDLTQN